MALTSSQQLLADTMSEISEFCWFASWLDGTEYRLWRFMTDPADSEPWGNYPIPQEYRERLQQLCASAGGWIYWHDGPDVRIEDAGTAFVSQADWQAMYNAHWEARQTDPMKLLPRRYSDYVEWFARHQESKE